MPGAFSREMAYFGRGEPHGCTAGGRSGDPRCTSPRAVYRRVFGVAGAGHGNVQALNLRYAWPSGDWGSLPLEGGIEAAYRRELDAAPDREHLKREIEGRLNRLRSPFRTAEALG